MKGWLAYLFVFDFSELVFSDGEVMINHFELVFCKAEHEYSKYFTCVRSCTAIG